jgi:hypothetical protein
MTDDDPKIQDFEELSSLSNTTAMRILTLPDDVRAVATGDHIVTFENPSTEERWYVGLSRDGTILKYHETTEEVFPIEVDTLETYVSQDTSEIVGCSHGRKAPEPLREAMKAGETDVDSGGSS